MSVDVEPVPLSFPAILRNPKLAHLHQDPPAQRKVKQDRPEPEGKRWVRRRENGALPRFPCPTLTDPIDSQVFA